MADELRADLALDVSKALRQLDQVGAQLTRALQQASATPLRIRVDTAGVSGAVESAVDAADTTAQVVAETSGVTSGIDAAVDAADSTVVIEGDAGGVTRSIDGAVAAADTSVTLTVDSSGINEAASGLQNVNQSALQTQQSVGGIGAAFGGLITPQRLLVAGAALLTGAVIKTGIEYNTLQQRALAAFETLLGSADAARQMLDSITEFARTSPFPREVFIEATQQMLSFGFAASEVVPILGDIQDAVAAQGGTADDIRQIVDVFKNISNQGKVTTEDLNRLTLSGIDGFGILARAAGVSGDEIRDRVTNNLIDADTAVTQLTEGMRERFGGAAAGLKNTFVGATDSVKGAFRDLSAEIVNSLVTPEGGGALVDLFNQLARLIREVLIPSIKELKPVIDATLGVIGALVENFIAGFQEIGPITIAATAAIGLLIIGLFNLRAIIASITATIAANPIGLLAVGIATAVTAIGFLTGGTKEATQEFKDFGAAVAEAGGEIDDTAKSALVAAFNAEGLSDDIAGAGASFEDFRDAVSSVTDAIRGGNKDLGELVDLVGAAIPNANDKTIKSVIRLGTASAEAEELQKNQAETGVAAAERQAEATKQASEEWQKFVDTIVSNVPTVQDAFSGLDAEATTQDFIDSLEESIVKTDEWVAQIQLLTLAGLGNLADVIAEQGPGNALQDDIATSTPESLALLSLFVSESETRLREAARVVAEVYGGSIPAAIADATPGLREAAKESGIAISEGTGEGFEGDISTTAQEALAAASAVFGDAANQVQAGQSVGRAVGLFFVGGFATGVTTSVGFAITAILGLFAKIVPIGESFGRQGGIQVGQATSQGIGIGIFLSSGQVQSALTSTVLIAAAGGLGAARAAGIGVGATFGSGVVTGIDSQRDDAFRAGQSLAQAAADGAANAGSPSEHLFYDAASKWPEAIARAFHDGQSLVTASARSLTNSAAGVLDTPNIVPRATVPFAPGASTGNVNNVVDFTVNVHGVSDPVQARVVGDEVGSRIAAQLDGRSRRLAVTSVRTG